jgi:C-22 sterol desaturase
MGPFLQSMEPKWSEYMEKWASGPLSCVSVFHKQVSPGIFLECSKANISPRFVVISSTRDMSRKIFNSPAHAKPCVVDVAPKLLGADNWVFLDGKAHVDFRKGLNRLFTRQALEVYLPGLQCAVACRTFVGHYISDEAVKKIADDYYLITAALELVNFPIIIPYTRTWYGKRAADMVLSEFAKCATKSKVRMAAGGEITCIMDGWVKHQLDSANYRRRQENGESLEGIEKPNPMLRDFTDYEISQTVFTLLFASQDATSSASTWLFQTMAQRPDVLDRVREENLRLRDGDRNKAVTMDMLDNMTYTRAAVRELLRYRPPVIMVPYLAKKAFPITDSYTVPKGMF